MSADASECPQSILFVEDNPGDIRLISTVLDTYAPGIRYDRAANYQRALEILGQDPVPHLVLLDLHIPPEGGLAVLEAMRQDERLDTIPVIVMSGSNTAPDILQSYRAGANAFIIKPVDLDEFEKKLHALAKFWCDAATLPFEVT